MPYFTLWYLSDEQNLLQANAVSRSSISLFSFFICCFRSLSITWDHLYFLTYTWFDLLLQECRALHTALPLWLAVVRRLSLPWCAI